MKSPVMGVPEGEDILTFEKQIPIALTVPVSIMDLEDEEIPLHYYLLIHKQLIWIENAFMH